MDTNRINLLLSKLYERLSDKDDITAIDIDLMLDYTRVIYADLLELKKENFSPEPGKNPAPLFPAAVAEEAGQDVKESGGIFIEIPKPKKDIIHTEDGITEEFIEAPAETRTQHTAPKPVTEDGEIYNAHDKAGDTGPETAGTGASQAEAVPDPGQPKEKEDIRTLIGINDRYLFMNELFHNNKFDYESVLDYINQSSGKDAVERWLKKEYLDNKKWNREDNTVDLFYGTVYKYFSNFR